MRLLMAVAALWIAGCAKQKVEPKQEDPPTSSSVAAALASASAVRQDLEKRLAITEAPTLAAALKLTERDMEDGKDFSSGTTDLASWATRSMKWSDVAVAKNETSYALVNKDSDAERGKRLCVSGTLIEIHSAKSAAGTAYVGGLVDGEGKIYRFISVKSTGTLVERNSARLCGVVTERQSYANSGGGTTHAVAMVGIFDLPENRKP